METVSDMIAGFLAGLTPGTRAQYRSVVSRWLRWCADNGIDMLRAKRTHIEVFAAYDGGMRPAAKNTVCRNLSVVCCLYRYLCEEGYIDCNPGEHVRRPKLYGHSDGSYLTREQARLFLDEARGMDARTDALCSLLLLTGARVSEALGLDVEAVEAALDAVEEMTETQGHAPSHVDLLYYRSQAHYDTYGRDKGDYAIVNARSREIGAILEAEGIEARFRYPEDDEAGLQRLANTR